jgi:hypothetical protein
MKHLDEMLDKGSRNLYNNLLCYGLEVFIDDYSELRFKLAISHLNLLISYFEEKEEFEKCSTLNEFLSLTRKIQAENLII